MGGAEQETREDGKEVKGEILDLIRGRMEGLRRWGGGFFIDGRKKEDTNVISDTRNISVAHTPPTP